MERNENNKIEYLGPLPDSSDKIEYVGPLPKSFDRSTITGKPVEPSGGFRKRNTVDTSILSILSPKQQIDFLEKLSPRDFDKVNLSELRPEAQKMYLGQLEQKQALDQAPWVDPAMVIPSAGITGGLLAKGGVKTGLKAGVKAGLAAGAMEPIVGTLTDEIAGDSSIAPLVNLAMGVGIGTVASKLGSKKLPATTKLSQYPDKVKAQIPVITGIEAKQEVAIPPLTKAFQEEFQQITGKPIPADTINDTVVGSKIWDDWIIGKSQKLLEKIPGGKSVNRALDYNYRYDLPDTAKYLHSVDDMHRAQRIGAEYAIDLGGRLNKYPERVQLKIGEVIKGGTANLNKTEQTLANEAKLSLYDLGKQAVDVGLLGEETFFKNAGRYMPRLYTKHEYNTLLTRYSLTKADRLDLSRFIQRKDIPEEIRKEMGEILTPGYPVAKGITQLTHDISMAKFFNSIGGNPKWAIPPGKKVEIPKGWKQLPDTKKLGKLRNSYVHPEIYEDVNRAIHVPGEGEKAWRKSLGMWKFGKVILSPKTHMRNLFSNSVLAHCGGMPLPKQPWYLIKAARSMSKQDELYQKAWQEGLMSNTFTNAELRELYGKAALENLEGDNPKQVFGVLNKFIKTWQGAKKIGNKAAKIYEAEEQWFKMAKMIHNMEQRGMDAKTAAADAEKWLFNYSKVTPFQESYRNKWYGAPFATFTFKALPRIAETAVTKPWRLALPLAMIWGLEEAARYKIGDTKNQAEAKKALRPEWMQGEMFGMSNFPRFPMKDEYGRDYYLNLTYMLPWGDIGESGRFMGIPGGILPMSQPFVKEPLEQILNYDNFWKEPIVKEADLAGKSSLGKDITEAKERGKHLFNTLSPTPAIDILKMYSAMQGEPDYKGRERPQKAVLADVLAGVKLYPVDYAEQMERKINKINPQNGILARELTSRIRTLTKKKQASKNKKHYQKQIDSTIDQLRGLAKESDKLGKLYKKTKNKEK